MKGGKRESTMLRKRHCIMNSCNRHRAQTKTKANWILVIHTMRRQQSVLTNDALCIPQQLSSISTFVVYNILCWMWNTQTGSLWALICHLIRYSPRSPSIFGGFCVTCHGMGFVTSHLAHVARSSVATVATTSVSWYARWPELVVGGKTAASG